MLHNFLTYLYAMNNKNHLRSVLSLPVIINNSKFKTSLYNCMKYITFVQNTIVLKFLICTTLCVVIFSSCISENDNKYILPANVQLSTFSFINPLFVESLMSPPLKFGDVWNDSLLALSKIYQIEFVFKGEKSPDHIAEKFEYQFNKLGQIAEFSYKNLEVSTSLFSKVENIYKNNELLSIHVPLFYGKKGEQKIDIVKRKNHILYIRNKENSIKDTTFIYLKNNIPYLLVHKLGDFVSKIHFILDINKPLDDVKNQIESFNISTEQLLLAEKTVTFTEKSLPQKSYQINEFFVKENLTEEWIYENNKKLIGFKKYINNQAVKEFYFNYSDDKILRSFTYNQKVYEVNYN